MFKEYEKNLQEKMREVKRLEEQSAKALQGSRPELTEENLRSLLELPQHLRAFWECVTTTNVERKQILRCLISHVVIKRRENSKYQDVLIHWMGGAITSLTIVKNGNSLHPEAIELMRSLAPNHTLTEIIDRLHEAGFRPTRGEERFSRGALQHTFRAYGIKLACPELSMSNDKPRGDGRYSALAVARMLNVSYQTIYRWCDWGILDAVRTQVTEGYFWIKITPEQVSALKNRSVKKIRKSDVQKFKFT